MQRNENLSPREAIEHAAGVRLRPILMTTAAMVVGMLPLVIAGGAGARSRAAIGIVIASGMSVGTLFTLFVTPAVYSLIARDHRDEEAKKGAGRQKSGLLHGVAPSVSPAHAEADAMVG
jgi:Cu/Ag efflux pump CusA